MRATEPNRRVVALTLCHQRASASPPRSPARTRRSPDCRSRGTPPARETRSASFRRGADGSRQPKRSSWRSRSRRSRPNGACVFFRDGIPTRSPAASVTAVGRTGSRDRCSGHSSELARSATPSTPSNAPGGAAGILLTHASSRAMLCPARVHAKPLRLLPGRSPVRGKGGHTPGSGIVSSFSRPWTAAGERPWYA